MNKTVALVSEAEADNFRKQLERIMTISTHVLIVGVDLNGDAKLEIATTFSEEGLMFVGGMIVTGQIQNDQTLHTQRNHKED
jgi:hypothetical protein